MWFIMCDKFSYKHFPVDELKECYNCCYYCSAVCPDLLDQSSDDEYVDDEAGVLPYNYDLLIEIMRKIGIDDDVFENLPF